MLPRRALHPDLAARLAQYRACRAFDAERWTATKSLVFGNYMKRHRFTAAVVGLSGGDAAVALALVKAAQRRGARIDRVVGVCGGVDPAKVDAVRALGAELVVVDQSRLEGELATQAEAALNIHPSPSVRDEAGALVSTPTLFYTARLLTQAGLPAAVVGPANRDEDAYLGLFAVAGRGVADVQLTADLHKSEVRTVGLALGLPAALLDVDPHGECADEGAVPTDFVELFTGAYLPLTPEQKQAFTAALPPPARAQFERWAARAASLHHRNARKLDAPESLNLTALIKHGARASSAVYPQASAGQRVASV
eukprot:TRINITY_DN11882_c0_g2_i1.p2 TRINITY_DN11882_c0_g2~~TRINITY_DN11882_c0_g2_i1.p2  ORF type:complete len:310 (+),score=95.65 TRINITY_DN11882_c0_g2_i1:71-1000(+)